MGTAKGAVKEEEDMKVVQCKKCGLWLVQRLLMRGHICIPKHVVKLKRKKR